MTLASFVGGMLGVVVPCWTHVDLDTANPFGLLMAVSMRKVPRTADELADLPDDGNRYELIDGELFVTPAPVRTHQRMVAQLFMRLHEFAASVGLEVMLSPTAVRASPVTEVEPDLLVLPRHFDGRELHRWEPMSALRLAIEILSPGTARVDRGRKRQLYLESGVPEYWVVDLEARAVEVWHVGAEAARIARDTLRWQPGEAATPLDIDLRAVFMAVLGPG
jgi:Uma2 family endonuclease